MKMISAHGRKGLAGHCASRDHIGEDRGSCHLITCGSVKPWEWNIHANLHGSSRASGSPSSRVDLRGHAGTPPDSCQHLSGPSFSGLMVLCQLSPSFHLGFAAFCA